MSKEYGNQADEMMRPGKNKVARSIIEQLNRRSELVLKNMSRETSDHVNHSEITSSGNIAESRRQEKQYTGKRNF